MTRRNFAVGVLGKRFGRLVVSSGPHKGPHGRLYECQCDCGKSSFVRPDHLVDGATQSCGCLRTEQQRNAKRKGPVATATRKCWSSMRRRCNNPRAVGYRNWGGRGITVCERWAVYENFLADMGERPSLRHSIDRIDNDGNYEPGNCRWATQEQQKNNRRNTVFVVDNGERKPLATYVAERGLVATLRDCLVRGHDVLTPDVLEQLRKLASVIEQLGTSRPRIAWSNGER